MLLPLLGMLVIDALALNASKRRCSRHDCKGVHCSHPGHEWFCLNIHRSYTDNSGRYYCTDHFRQRMGLAPIRRQKRRNRRRY